MVNGPQCSTSTGRNWLAATEPASLTVMDSYSSPSGAIPSLPPNYNRICVKLPLLLTACGAFAIGRRCSPARRNRPSADTETASHGHLILVLPFENHSGQPNIDWMSESMPEIINRRLESAGFLPIGREDRLYALDHLGLPPEFSPVAGQHHPARAKS